MQNTIEGDRGLSELLNQINDSQISSIKRVVQEIVRVISEPSSTAKELKEIIELDPPLTARVLRFANSAYFGRTRRISEIQQAVIWIGFDSLKEIALSQKVCELFKQDDQYAGYSRLQLWKHSVGAALCGKFIYRREFGERGDAMYAAGLLHDIGIIIIDQLMNEKFSQILDVRQSEQRNIPEIEQEILGFTHADIGKVLAENWGLPEHLVAAIGHHHNPDHTEPEMRRMPMVLFVSDYICHKNGIGYADAPFQDETQYRHYLQTLGIREKALEYIMLEVQKEIAKLEDDGWFHYDG